MRSATRIIVRFLIRYYYEFEMYYNIIRVKITLTDLHEDRDNAGRLQEIGHVQKLFLRN